ncbi:hypothetical protein GJAV_G00263750 [Gymnothorax javanicus]|nr:hypothetical protein GJAV_G00263750 [Gymnothorax javanicus]
MLNLVSPGSWHKVYALLYGAQLSGALRRRSGEPADTAPLKSQASGPAGGNMQLLETDFSRTLRELVELHLFHQNSIPAFLSAVTLDLFSRQTIA